MIYFLPNPENPAALCGRTPKHIMQARHAFLLAALVAFFSTGCSVVDKLRPYRIDVRQGNLVTQEMVSHLKKGMTRDQVRFALGTPLLDDIFHADRWDYIYRYTQGHGEPEQRKLTLRFENDQLVRVEGDVVAQTGEAGGEQGTVAPQRVRVIDLGAPPADEKKN